MSHIISNQLRNHSQFHNFNCSILTMAEYCSWLQKCINCNSKLMCLPGCACDYCAAHRELVARESKRFSFYVQFEYSQNSLNRWVTLYYPPLPCIECGDVAEKRIYIPLFSHSYYQKRLSVSVCKKCVMSGDTIPMALKFAEVVKKSNK